MVACSVVGARAQAAASSDVVISQVYTRGGEAGATYQNDFIEIFNRGTATVNINGYSLQIVSTTNGSTVATNVSFSSTRSMNVEPGQYFLFKLEGSGTNGQPLPVSENLPVPFLNLGSTSGKIALVRNNQAINSFQCPVGQDPDIADYVGYGNVNCAEGNAPTTAPTLTTVILRNGGGCDDTDNNAANFNAAQPNPRNTFSARNVCPVGETGGPTSLEFGATTFNVSESATHLDIEVNRTGDTSAQVSVDYATTDATASERQDYKAALGTLRFRAGETTKTVRILLTDDGYPEGGDETFQLTLSNPTGGASVPAPVATVTINDNDFVTPAANPLDDAQFFVRQHYHDFLNREPDADGFAFWTNQINGCGANVGCREVKRINASAAFFLSVEFQETGFFVYRVYKAALPETPARPRAMPRYREFTRDAQAVGRDVVVIPNSTQWLVQLDANKQDFTAEFVTRPEFLALYPASLSPAQYVDKLNAQAGGVLSPDERSNLVNGMAFGFETRASVLRKVAEDSDLRDREYRRAFVLTEYFGYLRRNPNDAPEPGLNYVGYDFWLGKLDEFNGNYINAEMVKGFITSGEYRGRFGAQ
jgi:hypothetical protein